MIVADIGDILAATERGFGKRTELGEFPRKGRGTQGVIAIQTSERDGNMIGAVQVVETHEVMLISNQGTLVRTRVSEIAQVGRNTQGVTLIRLPDDESLVSLARLEALPDELEEGADLDGAVAVVVEVTGETDTAAPAGDAEPQA
ncbi:MAG: hypothetical protein IPK97_19535 [Ahniella sp.]|nr:hypothetical protein [Ahniella sp.]